MFSIIGTAAPLKSLELLIFGVDSIFALSLHEDRSDALFLVDSQEKSSAFLWNLGLLLEIRGHRKASIRSRMSALPHFEDDTPSSADILRSTG